MMTVSLLSLLSSTIYWSTTTVLYILRKSIFWVSVHQFLLHSLQFFHFIRRKRKKRKRVADSRKSKSGEEGPVAVGDLEIQKEEDRRRKEVERRRKEEERRRREEKERRKLSTTLLNQKHQINYKSTRNFWTSQAGTVHSHGVQHVQNVQEHENSSFHDAKSTDNESVAYVDVFEDEESCDSDQKVLLVESRNDESYQSLPLYDRNYSRTNTWITSHNSSPFFSQQSYQETDEIDEEESSDEEFIRAFANDQEEEEALPILVNQSFSSDSVDFSGVGQQFMMLVKSINFSDILQSFASILDREGIEMAPVNMFFPQIKFFLKKEVPHRFDDFLDRLEARRNRPEYCRGMVAKGKKVLVIGAGPCGLRLAMESQFLGADTTVYEARPYMDRNNVLKLWAFVIEDLKNLGGKKFYPALGNGSLNTISIKALQFILVKICMLLGVRIHPSQTFKSIEPPIGSKSWTVVSERVDEDGRVSTVEEMFDAVFCSSGRKVCLDGFERQSFDANLAIAITANFENFHTTEEKYCKEIPGLSKQYDMPFFKQMEKDTGIKLENIVYYQDCTHYFVMTAKKESLLRKGVILQDSNDRDSLLQHNNINRQKLELYAREAAEYATRHFSSQIPRTPFAIWKDQNDVSIFDFTNLYRSQNACRVIKRNGKQILTGIVGDSLIEPFWPQGTGIGQGFLGVFDTAWMLKRYFEGENIMKVIRDREKLYCLLRQTVQQGLKTDYSRWGIDPTTRYTTTTFSFNQGKVPELFDCDESNNLQSDSVDFIFNGQHHVLDAQTEVLKRKQNRYKDGHEKTERETRFFAD